MRKCAPKLPLLNASCAPQKYPYQGVNGQCQFNKADVVAVPKNFTCLSGPQTASEVDMMEGLVKQPLSVCVDAASWQFYYDGVIENEGG